jgi:hypothetical protein
LDAGLWSLVAGLTLLVALLVVIEDKKLIIFVSCASFYSDRANIKVTDKK